MTPDEFSGLLIYVQHDIKRIHDRLQVEAEHGDNLSSAALEAFAAMLDATALQLRHLAAHRPEEPRGEFVKPRPHRHRRHKAKHDEKIVDLQERQRRLA